MTEGVTDLVPRPDPTALTTEQLLREITGVREYLLSELKAEINLTGEKFASIATQLVLLEKQRIEQKADVKAAVDAALQAQKEAVKEQTTASERSIAKSEAATSKQLDQLAVTFGTQIKGVTDLLNDTKERVGKVEVQTSANAQIAATALANNTRVTQAGKEASKETSTSIYAFAGFIVAVLVIVDIVLALLVQ